MNINDFDVNDFDMDALNNAIQGINKSIECGPECENENTKAALKLAYEKAQQNITTAPQQLVDAEKKYYETVFGLNAYREKLQQKYSDEIIQLIETERINISQYKGEIQKLIDEYTTSLIYLEKIDELKDKLEEENEKYKKDIDNYISTNNTNNRKAYYTEDQLSSIKKWELFLKVIYVILFIVLSVKLLYIEQLYKNKFTWIVLFILILLPYLFIPIFSKLIQLLFDWSSNKEDKSMITILKNIFTIIANEIKILSSAVMYPFEKLYNVI